MPRLRHPPENDFEIKPSSITGAGQGLFVRRMFAEDALLGPYTGELITYIDLAAGRFSGSNYLLGLTAKYLIAGEGPMANYTRYINHSSTPNALLVVSTRWKSAHFVAIRDISAGEEVFFDYGEEYWKNADYTPS
jgi:hypothetical protein|tara:strand:- start:658 stop:1062 length:405 start_codon:yes stop_codon:yes gene_type:complete